ncbi:transcriptional regulator, TetR family [Saccharopolyspora kobensis]|uniref:Transcriptional regulator, TetR family n=1 Tax=Saccharopolyspora kobensis TaxID=146035 RepID=A0A1H6BIS9_9PSEU|nr:TetR/AcrR family transcriptional regulator [Saccharopolyspora kobensis]SEG60106.1 transcriptional regulator, TetR family [Saccharopolyspora kobensis]SFE89184.1 transcriptional regulator, TetR family [Saccharopolyspora kobensis]
MAQARGSGSRGSTSDSGRPADDGAPARERILAAAGELFAEHGFEATPTSRIAERAEVPKGLIHYYFRRKQDLLTALVDRLPEEPALSERVVVRGDVAGSLRRLVRELDARLEASPLLSHLLWREADTHIAVREALQQRFRHVVEQIRGVIELALPPGRISGDVDTAALLLARVVNHRHSLVRHGARDDELDREIGFIARALESGIGKPRKIKPA